MSTPKIVKDYNSTENLEEKVVDLGVLLNAILKQTEVNQNIVEQLIIQTELLKELNT